MSGLAWLEFEKADLNRSERFAIDFGLAVHARTDDALCLRAARDGAPCVVIRQGSTSRFIGPVFQAAEGQDLDRLARATGGTVEARHELGSGRVVRVSDPSGVPVKAAHYETDLVALADLASPPRATDSVTDLGPVPDTVDPVPVDPVRVDPVPVDPVLEAELAGFAALLAHHHTDPDDSAAEDPRPGTRPGDSDAEDGTRGDARGRRREWPGRAVLVLRFRAHTVSP